MFGHKMHKKWAKYSCFLADFVGVWLLIASIALFDERSDKY